MLCGNAALDVGSRFPAAVFGEDCKHPGSDSVSALLFHFLLLQPQCF